MHNPQNLNALFNENAYFTSAKVLSKLCAEYDLKVTQGLEGKIGSTIKLRFPRDTFDESRCSNAVE